MSFIPKSMLDQADARVDKAMETGARGSTTTHTDYGVIGDAFFKKAQLDLQIAELKGNMATRKAEILSGLEIKKAELDLNARQLQIDAGFKAAEMKALAADRKVGFMEQLTGALGGAASGAMAGYSVGGPKGAMIGGAIGGGMTMMNYQQGGRRGGENAQRTLGHISTLAVAYKGMKDEQTQKDSMGTILKTGKAIMDEMNSARTPQERLAAMQKMEGFYGEAYATAMQMPGANPEKVGNMVASMRKGFEASTGLDPETARRDMRQLENLVKYQSDERRHDPKQQRAWANDYMREAGAIYEEEMGKPMPLNMQRQAAFELAPQVGEALDKKLGGSVGSFGSIPSRTREIHAGGGGTATQATTLTEDKPNYVPQTPRNPSDAGMPIMEDFGSSSQAIPYAPGIKGAVMDDGGDFTPVKSEMELTKQGTETAHTAQKMSLFDKVKHNMSLEDDEFDEKKIPIWEDRDKTVETKDGKVKTVRSQEAFDEENKELDVKLQKAGNSPEGARARSATKTVDRMIELVKKGDFPSDSQLKAVGAQIYTEGIPVGKGIGAGVGAAVSKGSRGSGAFIGSMVAPDFNVGKGAGPFLNDDEEFAVSEMEKYKAAVTLKFAKINDPGSRAVSDADARRFEPLWPREGQTREQQLYGLLSIKEMMLDEVETATNTEAAERTQKMKEFEEKEKIKTTYQHQRALNRQSITGGGKKSSFIPLDFYGR